MALLVHVCSRGSRATLLHLACRELLSITVCMCVCVRARAVVSGTTGVSKRSGTILRRRVAWLIGLSIKLFICLSVMSGKLFSVTECMSNVRLGTIMPLASRTRCATTLSATLTTVRGCLCVAARDLTAVRLSGTPCTVLNANDGKLYISFPQVSWWRRCVRCRVFTRMRWGVERKGQVLLRMCA